MAVFNPDIGGVPSPNMPDQTGASRGSIPNRSFEELFKGIGDTLDIAVKGTDLAIRQSIDKEATNIRDAALEPYNLPGEVKSGTEAIASLQAAFDQGKISDTYYYGQLTSLTKNLRSRYPGYEDVVDEAIMKATGVRPANAYREAIMAELDAQQSAASDEDKFQRQWAKENEKYIGAIAPDYFTNPEKYDFAQLQTVVASVKARDYEIDSEMASLDLAAKQGTANKTDAKSAAITKANQIAQTAMVGVSNTLGLDGTDLMARIQSGNFKGFSEEEYNAIVAEFGRLKASVAMQIDQALVNPLAANSTNSFASIIGSATDLDEVKKIAMGQIEIIEQALINKDYGMAAYYTRLNALQTDRDKATVLNASPDLRIANAIGTVSRDLAEQYLKNDGKHVDILDELIPELTARIVTGQDSFNGGLTRIANARTSAKAKSSGILGLTDKTLITITSGLATPEEVDTAVKELYAIDSNGLDLFGYVNDNEKYNLYNKVFNPTVTQAIINNGSRQALELYYNAAVNRIKTIPQFSQAAASVNDRGGAWANNFEVKFDPASGRISVVATKPVMYNGPWGVQTDNTAVLLEPMQKAANAINGVFDNLSPMLDGLGVGESDKVRIYNEILGDLNVSLENGKREGFFEWLQKALAGDLDKVDDKREDAPEDVSFNMVDSEPSTPVEGEIDESYFDSIRAAESGGNDSAKNPNSTATGRYQFLTSTWNDLAARYPDLKLTDRTDPEQQERAIRVFTNENKAALEASGINPTNANLYAAHFLGSRDAIEVLRAPDTALVSDYVAPRVITANKFLKGMTVAKFKQWAQRKAG